MATRLISKTWQVEGVPTDVTSAKLSDPTGTYGIKRNDTGEIIVPDGTDMTHSGTGQYQYSFEDEEGVAYTGYIEIVYGDATYYFEVDIPARVYTTTLGLTYSDLQRELADFLGWGRDIGKWTTADVERLDAIINGGYRQFLYPPPVPGETVAHRWSFLRPSATLTTESGTYLYDMPSDFGAIIGDLVYDADANVHQIIEQTTPGMIDRNRAVNNIQGRPYLFALRPKTADTAARQTTELMLYPTPDAEYGLVYHYDVVSRPLSEGNPYPLGGAIHSETLLQSCRDIAAAHYKDDPGGREHVLFLERLHASVEADRRLSPKTLGFNDDGQRVTYTRHGTNFRVYLKHTLGGG